MNKTLIIIPAYNEEGSIERVINNLIKECPNCDYLIVNDGSKDKTVEICKKNGFNFLDLSVNLGLSGAFTAGMKYAYLKGYEMAIQFDADGQHLPQYISKMIKKMEDTGCDIVIGSRFVNKKKPKSLRMLGSNLISSAIKLTTGKKLTDPTSGMRLWNRKLIKEFAQEINITPEPDTVSYFIKNNVKVEEIQVVMEERITGQSYLNFTRSIMYMSRMLISILLVQLFRGRLEFKKEV